MNKRIIIILGIAALLITLGMSKLFSNKEKNAAKLYIHDSNAQVLVSIDKVQNHTFENALSFLGTLEPSRQNTISSDASGKIIRLDVKEGDRLTTGQVIAKVDDELLRLQLENAEISLEGLKNDDARNSNLAKENVITGVQVEKTKLAIRSAETQIKQIKRQIKNTTITAPFSGVITKKMIELGSIVGPGTPLLEVTDISSLKLTVSVPERDILKFKIGQEVSVFVDVHKEKSFSGRATLISVKADATHNFKVEITVQNSSSDPLMAGMYGSVKFKNQSSITALSIPRKALVGSTKHPKVYLAINGKSVLKSFSPGTSDNDFVEVVSGITSTDLIIVKGQINLQNNTNISITGK